jgi:perosamine synthetase
MIQLSKPTFGLEERAAVDRVLTTGQVAQGPEVASFEAEFSAQLARGRDCVAVNSGTSGLHLGLLAAGVGPGDEVIVPSFTFAATANAVALTGAQPVFADIEPNYYSLSPSAAEAAITSRTVAIMPVHLYGHPADMTALTEVAERHRLQIFEDAAQAHGASWHGRNVGMDGDFAMFSFYPTKNMSSIEGGMVTCGPELGRRVRLLRNQGMDRPYENELVGLNNRMSDVHAAVGRVQLRRLPDWTRRRQENAKWLDAALEGVTPPAVAPGAVHVYHQYTIRVPDDRDGLKRALLEEHGVSSAVYYPTPVHRLPPFASDDHLPETDIAAKQVLSLPVHPHLSPEDLELIATAVAATMKAGT